MEIKTIPDLQPFVDDFIKPGFVAEVQEEVRLAVEEAVTRAMADIRIRLGRKIPKMFGSIAVKLSTMLTVESVGREIRITIHNPEEKKS
jgi:hypothetical protein